MTGERTSKKAGLNHQESTLQVTCSLWPSRPARMAKLSSVCGQKVCERKREKKKRERRINSCRRFHALLFKTVPLFKQTTDEWQTQTQRQVTYF